MSTQEREARFQRRVSDLYEHDQQFAAARPDPEVGAAADRPGLRLPDVVGAVMAGYAERPALGARAVEHVTDAAGRTTATLLPRFDTISYGQLWERVTTLAAALRDEPVAPGDRVA